jgi:hypothetical protein
MSLVVDRRVAAYGTVTIGPEDDYAQDLPAEATPKGFTQATFA